MVLISRSDIASPLQPGQEKEIELTFQNLSTTKLKSPVVTITPSDGLTLSGGSSSFVLEEIAGKKSATLKVRIKAADVISSSSQSLGVELKFNYYNNISSVQASVTDKVTIPAQARESVPQPVVIVTRSPMDTPIAPDETREMTVTFQNAGSAKLVAPVVTVAPLRVPHAPQRRVHLPPVRHRAGQERHCQPEDQGRQDHLLYQPVHRH